ncbi:hypothetical protein F4604DRAFT_1675367 [Suillus subluteus]|nr:hypothetical protein F4604DRAFT_1675367 [Suillus subluteus]
MCLLKLREKSAAWSTLSPQTTKHFSVMSHFDHASIYHDTLYLTRWIRRFESPSTVISQAIDLHGAMIPITNTHPVDPTFHLACVDASQDLRVYVSYHDGQTHSFFHLLFESMSTDTVHPLVHNSGIISSRNEFPCEFQRDFMSVAVFCDRVASSISLYKSHPFDPITGRPPAFVRSFVEILNWQENHGVQFLNAERLLVMAGLGYIEVYDIKDLCQVPKRLAIFELPCGGLSIVSSTASYLSPSCVRHVSAGNQWIWKTNTMDRLICVKTRFTPRFIVISPRAFDAYMTPLWMDSDPVAWEMWGPTNCRCFLLDKRHDIFAVGGTRFAWSAPISNTQDTSIQLHVADFNPSTVVRGIGRVIHEPVTTSVFIDDAVTTSLPYVEVVSSQVYPTGCISRIMLDEERLLLFTSSKTDTLDLQVMEM